MSETLSGSIQPAASTMPRPRYTEDQIFHIYERIDLPSKWRLDLEQANQITRRGDQALDFLSVLTRHMLASVPFENVGLHYSRAQMVDLHPELLYLKIVSQGTGRGGYCLENNAFFATILRTLGFELISTAARVSTATDPSGDSGDPSPKWTGISHMINIVTIEEVRYMVDVGFGVRGACKPVPLQNEAIHVNIRPNQYVRLRLDTLEDFEDDTSRVWIFERRFGEENAFVPCYSFPDNVEFLSADFNVMNHFASTSKKSLFTQQVIAVKYNLSDDQSEITGETVVVGDKLHRWVDGEKEDLGRLESEEQRVDALQQHLGICLSGMQRTGILGMHSMIG